MSTSLTKVLPVGVALLLAGALFLTANASLSADPVKISLPTLRLNYLAGLPSLAQTLDPPLDYAAPAADTIALTNANLVHILPNGKVASDLATWTVSKNHLVYTFAIHKNGRFSNGHYVTAQDAAFSIRRALAPSTASSIAPFYLGLIHGADTFHSGRTKVLTGVKVLSRRTLRITISKPAAYFLAALTYPTADVLDPAVVSGQSVGTPPDFKDNYLTSTCTANQGAGPFKFVCLNATSGTSSFYRAGHTPMYTFVPNPYYYGRKPHVRIELPGYATAQDAYKQYLAGKLDTTSIPAVYLSRWKGRSQQYRSYPSSSITYLTPNVRIPPFDNVHCRLAVAYAVDRDTLANRILTGYARPTYGVVPRGMLGYYPGNDNPHYDPVRARAELAKCPSRTTPFELLYGRLGPEYDNAFTNIATTLSTVGMNVKLKGVSADDWLKLVGQPLDRANIQIIHDSWEQDYPDPQDYCTLLLHSSGGWPNIGRWHNSTYDRLVERADVESNRSRRAQIYIQAQHLALSQGAFISVSNGIASVLIKPYVHGLIGSEAYARPVPKNYDWANVSISKH